jgi:hypothetical protein
MGELLGGSSGELDVIVVRSTRSELAFETLPMWGMGGRTRRQLFGAASSAENGLRRGRLARVPEMGKGEAARIESHERWRRMTIVRYTT